MKTCRMIIFDYFLIEGGLWLSLFFSFSLKLHTEILLYNHGEELLGVISTQNGENRNEDEHCAHYVTLC